MRLLKRVFLSVVVSLTLLVPSLAYAQITPTPAVQPPCYYIDVGGNNKPYCIPTDPATFVKTYYQIGLGLIGGLAIMFIMVGGYIILTSRGNPQALNNGKTYIGYAIAGLLLAIFGYLFVEVIAGNILHIPGFS